MTSYILYIVQKKKQVENIPGGHENFQGEGEDNTAARVIVF